MFKQSIQKVIGLIRKTHYQKKANISGTALKVLAIIVAFLSR